MFRDRFDAGRQLAQRMTSIPRDNSIVLALPRGGVAVGFEVARLLDLPLDVIIARKIGAPFQPEYAVGVVAENGFVSVNQRELHSGAVSDDYIRETTARLRAEIAERQKIFRDGRGLPTLEGKNAIIIDDGVATGFTLLGAISAIRDERPACIVVGLPVAPPAIAGRLREMVDQLIVVETPEPFDGVGRWYVDFEPVSDAEVVDLLRRAGQDLQQQEEAANGTRPPKATFDDHPVPPPA